MPSTINVNKLTVVHSGSGGISSAFPDVCKTPTPGGPVPVPYPNIAQSSDTADGSSTVKMDGNPIMLKSSNFRMSTGDEAGSAMNVMSNKIKGKAEPMLYSFDVKVDGQNVFRLTDLMLQNCGSTPGTPPATEAQGPLPEGTLASEECTKVKKEREKQNEKDQFVNAGMLAWHFDAIKDIAKRHHVIFYFRKTSQHCHAWIQAEHQPKPHKVFKGNTIVPEDPQRKEGAAQWLWEKQFQLMTEAEEMGLSGVAAKAWVEKEISDSVNKPELLGSNARYASCKHVAAFFGVVGGTRPGNQYEPLKSDPTVPQITGNKYENRWITGDYDIYHIIHAINDPPCASLDETSPAFSQIKKDINQTIGWDAIQHGPQTQWVATKHDVELGAPKGTNFPKKVAAGFKNNNPFEEVPIKGRPKGMKVFDNEVTVIAPGGTVFLKGQQDTFDALKCRECDKTSTAPETRKFWGTEGEE